MLDLLKKLFGSSKKQDAAEVAPYKVETPSTTVGTVPLTTQYAEPVVEPTAEPKKKPAAKKPAGEKKPAVKAKTARTKKK